MTPQTEPEVKRPPETPVNAGRPPHSGRAAVVLSHVLTPYVVLVAALLVTGLVAYMERSAAQTRTRLRLETMTQETRDTIVSRLQLYESLLRAGAGIFAASDQVTRDEFGVFARVLDVRKNYPGLQGIGYAARFTASEKQAVIQRVRGQGMPDFRVWPDFPRQEYTSIVYLEPLDERNRAAIGFDMMTEPVRREAMARARDTAEPAASGTVVLQQENGGEKLPGFLIYHPVYTPGPEPRTVEERRRRLAGFIYCPLRTVNMLSTMIDPARREMLDIEVYDGTSVNAATKVFDSWSDHPPGWETRALKRTVLLHFGARTWTMTTAARPTLRTQANLDRPVRILLTGLAVSLLLFALTLSQSQARRQAEESAAELARSREALIKANQRTTTMMESITDGLIAVDRNWRIIYVNHQALELARRASQDTVGRNLWDVYPDLANTDAEAAIRSSMSTGVAVQFEAADALMPEWADIRAYPSGDGLALYFADIGDRKRAEKSLVEAYRQQQQIATTLQRALLAIDNPAIRGVSIEPYYRAAYAEALVGGDFYDVFEPAPGLLGIVIGDVAGKGLAAATRTAFVKSTLRAFAYEDPSPSSVLSRLNRVVTKETQDGFVTLLYGVLNTDLREFVFANAGHEPPLWLIPDGPEVQDLEKPGIVLGILPEVSYEQFRIAMDCGHRLFFYTDGLTEARGERGFYGIDRLRSAFLEMQRPTAADTLSAVIEEVNTFAHGEIRDDVAAVLVCLD